MRSHSLTVVSAILATACGGSSVTGGGGNPPPGASVNMAEYTFTPETLTVTVGTVVQWTNEGTTDHTSTSDSAGLWNSSDVAPPGPPPMTCPYPPCTGTPGATFQFRFTTAGTYPYHCSFHGVVGSPTYHGMVGVIKVTP